MKTQREYWDKKINEWSSAAYGRKSQISLIEKIATYFRAVNKDYLIYEQAINRICTRK